MKIEKLYTLRQFVEIIENELDPKNFTGNKYNWPGVYNHVDAIFKYNAFLKQPLKKEMFVNPVTHPNYIKRQRTATEYNEMHATWRKFEDKVICNEEDINPHDTCIMSIHFGIISYGGNTLHDLAEATKGELKLKNVEL